MLDGTDASIELQKAIIEKYEIVELLGKGSYGTVLKGVCKQTNRKVALKISTMKANREYDYMKILFKLIPINPTFVDKSEGFL